MTLEEKIVKLNEIKRSFGSNSFTQNELKEILKKAGFKSTSQLIIGMRACNIIVGSPFKGSTFNEIGTPVYIKTLERAIKKGLDMQNKYQKVYLANKIRPIEPVVLSPIEEAIKLLKENGYKIYKPTFEEI